MPYKFSFMANIGRMHNYATIARTDLSKSKKNIVLWLIHATGFNALYSRDSLSTNIHDACNISISHIGC